MPSDTSLNPANTDLSALNSNCPALGEIVHYGGKLYRFILLKDAVAAAAGSVVFVAKSDFTWGTCDYTGGSTGPITGVPAIGIAVGTITGGNYGLVLVQGYYGAIKTNGDDDIAAGDLLITGAADGVCDSLANAAAALNKDVFLKLIGYASAADVDADNTVAGLVKLL